MEKPRGTDPSCQSRGSETFKLWPVVFKRGVTKLVRLGLGGSSEKVLATAESYSVLLPETRKWPEWPHGGTHTGASALLAAFLGVVRVRIIRPLPPHTGRPTKSRAVMRTAQYSVDLAIAYG